jgi:hypothetical protein
MHKDHWVHVFFEWLLHGVALLGVVIFILPLANWYIHKKVTLGVDFFNSATYVKLLASDWQFRAGGWKDVWFSGAPLASDYPSLHFYFIAPLVSKFGLVTAVRVYMMVTVMIFAAGAYASYWKLGHNRALAFILAVGVGWSVGVWGALIWGGSLPFFASQLFFPVAMWMAIGYLQSKSERWWWSLVVWTGLAYFGHPLVVATYIYPVVTVLFWLWPRYEEKFLNRMKRWIGWILLSTGMGIVEVRTLLSGVAGILWEKVLYFFGATHEAAGRLNDLSVAADAAVGEKNFAKSQLASIVTQTNEIVFLFLIVAGLMWLVALLVRKKKKTAFRFLPMLGVVGYVIGYIALYAYGIPLFHGGWYRTFWAVPLVVGGLAAGLWGTSWVGFWDRVAYVSKRTRYLQMVLSGLCGAVFFAVWVVVWPKMSSGVVAGLESRSTSSSAFPDAINTLGSIGEITNLARKMTPNWMDTATFQYRLYANDATVNIWWNAFYNLPLVRGYIDPPLNTAQRWGLFWIDSVMGVGKESDRSSLQIDWGVPEHIVEKNALYLIDWYAVRYLEGNHASQSSSALAKNVIGENLVARNEEVKVFGTINRYGTASGKEEWNPDLPQSLNYYEIKPELVSPVLRTANAKAIMMVGSDNAYDSLTRFMGMKNFNSRMVVLAKGPENVDELSVEELRKFDALFLYDYKVGSLGRGWAVVEKYLKGGGAVFVETGTEFASSQGEQPWFFPVKSLIRSGLGKEWDGQVDERFAKDVNVNSFSPLVYNGQAWNISHPDGDGGLTEGSEVLMRQRGIPVMAINEKWGGKLVWSGLNLPYHIIRDYNEFESNLLTNVLVYLTGSWVDNPGVSVKAGRENARRYWIEGSGKGVLFKQQYFPGWQAEVDGTKAKIYPAGPSYPGFMYVPLTNMGSQPGNHRIEFKYYGDVQVWMWYVLSFGILVIGIDKIVIGGVIASRFHRLRARLTRPMGEWWERDHVE